MSAYGPVRQITQSLDPATIDRFRATSRPPPEAQDLLTVGILYPILETLLFLLLYWAMQRDGDLKLRTRSYILLMGALGWLLHGASFQSINRILPFALLAWLFRRWGERAGARYGFAAAAVAHIVWNSSLLLIYFARNGFG